jgi:hypothetical protein
MLRHIFVSGSLSARATVATGRPAVPRLRRRAVLRRVGAQTEPGWTFAADNVTGVTSVTEIRRSAMCPASARHCRDGSRPPICRRYRGDVASYSRPSSSGGSGAVRSRGTRTVWTSPRKSRSTKLRRSLSSVRGFAIAAQATPSGPGRISRNVSRKNVPRRPSGATSAAISGKKSTRRISTARSSRPATCCGMSGSWYRSSMIWDFARSEGPASQKSRSPHR